MNRDEEEDYRRHSKFTRRSVLASQVATKRISKLSREEKFRNKTNKLCGVNINLSV